MFVFRTTLDQEQGKVSVLKRENAELAAQLAALEEENRELRAQLAEAENKANILFEEKEWMPLAIYYLLKET